jgi:hypothetical protein
MFQRPLRSGFFLRSPAKTFFHTLQGMIAVVRAADRPFYRLGMEDSIRDCFTAILHPQTAERYRSCGIDLFCALSDHLYDSPLDHIPQSFESLVLNFALAASVWPDAPQVSEDIDPEKRIQIEDSSSKKPLDLFMQQIGCLRKYLLAANDAPKLVYWWEVIYRILLRHLYAKTPPLDLHRFAVDMLLKVCDRQMLPFLLERHSPIIFQIVGHCSEKLLDEGSRLISCLVDVVPAVFARHPDFLQTPVRVLLRFLETLFQPSDPDWERIQTVSDTFVALIRKLIGVFPHRMRLALFRDLVTFDERANFPYVLHILGLLLGTFVDMDIVDPTFWAIIAETASPDRIVILSCFAYFAAYWAVCVAPTLLQFDVAQAHFESLENMTNWLPDDGLWELDLSGFRNPKEVAEQNKEIFLISDDRCYPALEEMRFPALDLTKDRGRVLKTAWAMLGAFDWKSLVRENGNSDIEYKIFLVTASFIFPFVRLTQFFPITFKYDRAFLLTEFLDWLRGAIDPSLTNDGQPRIVPHGLLLLGRIICRRTSLNLLGIRSLAAWYELLRIYAESANQTQQRHAISFAADSLLLGFEGATILIGTVARHCDCFVGLSPVDSLLPEKKLAACFMCLNLLFEISSDVDFAAESRMAIKQGTIRCLNLIQGPLRIPALVATLLEESLAKRSISSLGKLLVRAIGGVSNEADGYALMPITLIITELHDTNGDAIDRLLRALFERLRSKPLDDTVFIVLFELVVDILVESASLIEWGTHFTSFSEIASNLDHLPSAQAAYLSYQVLLFANKFLTFPGEPTTLQGVSGRLEAFRTGDDRLLQVNREMIISWLPIGRFGWRFRWIGIDPPAFDFDEDIKLSERIANETEFDVQRSFSSEWSGFFTTLYERDLGTKLWEPQNFEASPITLTPNKVDFPQPQKAAPAAVGVPSLAFLSSLNFFEIPICERFTPATIPRMANVTVHGIDVCFVAKELPHFNDFKAGLGFLDEAGGRILAIVGQHEVSFHLGQGVHPVVVVWIDGMSQDELIVSYNAEHRIRIEIESTPTGLFRVQFMVHRRYAERFPNLHEVLVSKRALPAFVVGQILTTTHVLDLMSGPGMVRPLWKAAVELRDPAPKGCPRMLEPARKLIGI